LLIVVAVILIISAIAIPNFLRSKMAANEASAVQNLRRITTAEYLYSSLCGINYSADLPSLSGTAAIPSSSSAELIDQVLAGGQKSGYGIAYTPGTADSQGHIPTYSVTASLLTPGSTGMHYFYTDQTAVIRWNSSTTAGPADTPQQ
jgi:type IV pilus assembly protein PilA